MENAGKYPLSSFTLIGHVIRRRNRAQILWKIVVSTEQTQGKQWKHLSRSPSIVTVQISECDLSLPSTSRTVEESDNQHVWRFFFGQLGVSMC